MDDERNDHGEHRLARLTDEELVALIRRAHADGRRALAGDGFAMLHFRHARRVRGMLRSKVPAERADELEQEVFLAAFEGVTGSGHIASFQAWLTRTTRNHIAELWRGRDGRQIKQDREAAARIGGDPDAPPRPEPATDGGYGEWETSELIGSLLAGRTALHRDIVEIYVIDGGSAEETARRTGATPDNVYQVAHRFRADLRRLLEGGRLDDNDDPGDAGRTGPTPR